MKKALLRAILVFTVASPAAHGSQTDPPHVPASLPKFVRTLENLVPELLGESLVPGAGVAVIRRGEVVYQQGHGHADANTKASVTPDTGFNIGSISKTVAAWGVMKLVEAGKIELDAPVSTVLTRWHLPDSEFDRSGVTMRRLLSHTAGLSLHGYPGWGPADPLPTLEASLSGATNGPGDVRLIMNPGTKWQYSGGGYTLAQLIVEEVSGRSFAPYMRAEVLRPLGMTRSDYELTEAIVAGSSRCYDVLGLETPNPRFTAQAAAGLHTTISDLATFAAAALPSSAGPPGRGVLKAETVHAMLTAPPPSDAYALGYGLGKLPDGNQTVGHGGSNRGWQAMLRVVPATGEGIVVTTNGSNGGVVLRGIVNAWSEWLTGRRERFEKPFALPILKALLREGSQAAVATYQRVKADETHAYFFSEDQLNRIGYELLNRDRVEDAITIFKLNIEAFPSAANPYDSLGEAYRIAGNRELAIQYYKKTLELNPDNANARQVLVELEKE